jgi:hypothetical protein
MTIERESADDEFVSWFGNATPGGICPKSGSNNEVASLVACDHPIIIISIGTNPNIVSTATIDNFNCNDDDDDNDDEKKIITIVQHI